LKFWSDKLFFLGRAVIFVRFVVRLIFFIEVTVATLFFVVVADEIVLVMLGTAVAWLKLCCAEFRKPVVRFTSPDVVPDR